jgi:AcrR family transcriptional regulator
MSSMPGKKKRPVPAPPKRRGYGGRSADELAAERREKLMQTALELFGTVGYAATPTEKLCAEARVTTRHFYEQFKDREALLIAVFERVMQETRERVLAVFADPATAPEARLLAALDEFLDAQLDDPRRARLTTMEVLGVSPRVEAARNAVITGFAALVEAWAEALAAGGQLAPRNYRVLAFGLVGAMHELQIVCLDPANGLDRDMLKAELAFIVRALLAGAAPSRSRRRA